MPAAAAFAAIEGAVRRKPCGKERPHEARGASFHRMAIGMHPYRSRRPASSRRVVARRSEPIRTGYLRSEMTIPQWLQRNTRSAGYKPALRRSVTCVICTPQSSQVRVGVSSERGAETAMPHGWQINRFAAEQFGTLSKINAGQVVDLAYRERRRPRMAPNRARDGRSDWSRRCHQLPLQPCHCSRGYHRIKLFGHNLMDSPAGRALKCRDIEARGARCNPHQPRCYLARRTSWRGMVEHDLTP